MYGDGARQFVSMDSCNMEPIAYALFFLYGERGWGRNDKDPRDSEPKLPFLKYLAFRMLKPDELETEDGSYKPMTMPAEVPGSTPNREIVTNRFWVMSRLGEVYFVDMVSRSIDFQIRWITNNQRSIFQGSKRKKPVGFDHGGPEDESDDSDGEAPDKEPAYLPSSFFGSPRYLRTKAINALTVVSELGPATGFLTLTCNPLWPEIQEQLLKGQKAFHRPDIVAKVFHGRLSAFLHNLSIGAYFKGGGAVEYIMHVIEFQHRGLPHAHIVYRQKDAPSAASKDASTIEFIDDMISAEMPNPVMDFPYYNLVSKHMLHKCSCAVNGCKKNPTAPCKRRYSPQSNLEPVTRINDNGYPVYRRRFPCDRMVVPHNRAMLLAWNGHANLEYAASSKSIMYLYKYLYKGPKPVRVDLNSESEDSGEHVADGIDGEDAEEHGPSRESSTPAALKDEIKLYLKGRFICSMDAAWRIYGYKTYPSPTPRVRVIKVKLPDQVDWTVHNDNHTCDMLVYFHRPPALRQLKYTELFSRYIVCKNLPRRYASNTAMEGREYYRMKFYAQDDTTNCDFTNGHDYLTGPVVHLCLRAPTQHQTITRMQMLYVSAGEIWYLRLILAHSSPTSFHDALSHNGREYSSFQAAAIAKNLVRDSDEPLTSFRELCALQVTPAELRGLFATMLKEGFPMMPVYEDPDIRTYLISDFCRTEPPVTETAANNDFLLDLCYRLQISGKALGTYGLPVPIDGITEYDRAQLQRQPPEYYAAELERLQGGAPRNAEQDEAFHKIIRAVQEQCDSAPSTKAQLTNDPLRDCKFFMIEGKAGTGKTELTKQIQAAVQSMLPRGELIRICASTALAARNFENGVTAHSLFGYPVTDDEEDQLLDPACCQLSAQRLQLLKNVRVIFWDEFVSNHRVLFESVTKVYAAHSIRTIFVCSGDFRQILPVVPNGTPDDVVAAVISSNRELWSKFEVCTLRQNMRLLALGAQLTSDSTPEQVEQVRLQVEYNKTMSALSEAKYDDGAECHRVDSESDESKFMSKIVLPGLQYYTSADPDQSSEALTWLYPNGFVPNQMVDSCVLATTNVAGDEWNRQIQALNPAELHELRSHDNLCEIDDPHGYIKDMMGEPLLNTITQSGVPAHNLQLKVSDVCIVLRSVRGCDIANNQRVLILDIKPNYLRVQTIESFPRQLYIPRIRFKFGIHKYGQNYTMMRTQFPLRLSYCMTYNKSQGQTLKRVLLDTTGEPFAHGHAYVALSRVRKHDDIKLYLPAEQLHPMNDSNVLYPKISNIVYPSVLIN